VELESHLAGKKVCTVQFAKDMILIGFSTKYIIASQYLSRYQVSENENKEISSVL
jgi:hypothetical protein